MEATRTSSPVVPSDTTTPSTVHHDADTVRNGSLHIELQPVSSDVASPAVPPSDVEALQLHLAAIFAASEVPPHRLHPNDDDESTLSSSATTTKPDTTVSRHAKDFSETFRLYFGSNITIFPYLVSLGGLLGSIGCSIPVLLLLQESASFQCSAKLIASDIMTTRRRREEPSSPNTATPSLAVTGDPTRADRLEQQVHTEINSFISLAEALWCYPLYDSPGVPSTASKVVSRVPQLVQGVMLLAQMVSACSFASLVAGNMEGFVKGMYCRWNHSCASEHPPTSDSHPSLVALAVGSFVLCVSTIFYKTRTYSLYAATNNFGLISAALIMLIAAISHQTAADTSASVDELRLFPRQQGDIFLFFPILIAYMTPAMFVTDVQTSIARRGFAFHRQQSWTGFQAMARFQRVLRSAAVVAMTVLLSFGSFLYFTFREATNAVIALSLPPGANLQLLLAAILAVSTLACGTLNLGGIIEVMDHNNPNRATSLSWRSILYRAMFFVAIFTSLSVIPFFDLVASLSGSLGLNMFTFFFPVLFLVQSKRRAWEVKEQQPQPHSALHMWWWHTSLREKCFSVMFVVCGTVLLVTGVGNVLLEVIRR